MKLKYKISIIITIFIFFLLFNNISYSATVESISNDIGGNFRFVLFETTYTTTTTLKDHHIFLLTDKTSASEGILVDGTVTRRIAFNSSFPYSYHDYVGLKDYFLYYYDENSDTFIYYKSLGYWGFNDIWENSEQNGAIFYSSQRLGSFEFSKKNGWYYYVDITDPWLPEGTPPAPSYDKDMTLFIDDMNFRKRFSFQFHIPLEKEDTKYFVFLDKYKRNTYNSVTASFVIYTVATPEDYDYSEYENYLYYDDLSKKLFLPAGCTIKKYSCTLNNGTKAEELTLDEEFVAARDIMPVYNLNFTDLFLKELVSTVANEAYPLVPIDVTLNLNSVLFKDIIYAILNNVKFKVSGSIGDDGNASGSVGVETSLSLKEFLSIMNYETLDELLFNKVNQILYYGDEVSFNFDDFCFSNYPIFSYENERYSLEKKPYYYKFFRKTKVYNLENQINENMFALQYTDSQDVSSLLPDGIDVGYLTSPFYEENKNSSSGGNLTYDIDEILNGDKILDYSKEDNSIHNNFNGDYIENFEEGDNITINNNYTTIIDKTSDENILHNIYIEVLEIKTLLAGMDDSTSNYINNITYNIENNVKYFFIPSKFYIKDNLKQYDEKMKDHLGIIYQPFEFLVYTLGLFSEMDNTTEILLDIPEISFKEHTLIPYTKFSFTNYFNELPILNQIHEIYLTAVDFVVLGLLIKYAIKVYKEVFNK